LIFRLSGDGSHKNQVSVARRKKTPGDLSALISNHKSKASRERVDKIHHERETRGIT